MERRPSRRPLRHHAQRHFSSQAFGFTQVPKKRSGLRRSWWPAGRAALHALLARARLQTSPALLRRLRAVVLLHPINQ